MIAGPFPSSFTISLMRVHRAIVWLGAHGAAAVEYSLACGMLSHQAYESYVPPPLDLPWRGHLVRLQLTRRRFRCRTATRSRGTFAEDFGTALPRYARRRRRQAGSSCASLRSPAAEKECALAECREFATGIGRDRAAVEAALWLDVSNGQTEG